MYNIFIIKEILGSDIVLEKVGELKATKNIKMLEKFYRMIDTDPDRAYYGYDHVLKASESNAIDSLLITDHLFKNKNINERKKYISFLNDLII